MINQICNVRLVRISEATLNNGLSRCWQHDDQRRIQNSTTRQNGQDNQPEPQENVDLFVENVNGQNAHGIVFLNAARRSVLVKSAFCHTWKDRNHWIRSILLIVVRELNHFGSIRREGSTQESIDHYDVQDDIQKVQQFTKEVTKRITIVHTQTRLNVLDEFALPGCSFLGGNRQSSTESFSDHSHLAILPVLPDHVRRIETDALEEEHERHPLVVAVESLILVVVAQAGLCNIRSGNFIMFPRQRIRVGNPAIGADHMVRD